MHESLSQVEVPERGRVSVRRVGPEPGRGPVLILAHGAGSDMNEPLLCHVQKAVAARGIACLTFNFPYKEQGRKPPDRAPVLEATWRAVIGACGGEAGRLFIGGKSMGGRMASHLAAQGVACAGLVLLGYPLHPARKPERLRVDHFPAIRCPSLFIQGTRDPLCELERLEPALNTLGAPATLHRIEGGDHSFKVLKRLNRSEEAVRAEIVDTIVAWIESR